MMPDKVYLEEGRSVPVVGFVGPAWNNPKDLENPIEFIRKDTLWKWADEYYSKCILNNGRDTGRREVLKSLLHYINRT